MAGDDDPECYAQGVEEIVPEGAIGSRDHLAQQNLDGDRCRSRQRQRGSRPHPEQSEAGFQRHSQDAEEDVGRVSLAAVHAPGWRPGEWVIERVSGHRAIDKMSTGPVEAIRRGARSARQ